MKNTSLQFPIWQISPCFTIITDDDILIAPCAGQHKAINTSAVLHGCSVQFPGEGMTYEISWLAWNQL